MLTELLHDVRYRLRALFRRAALERDLDAELRFHIEQEAAKYVRAGDTPAEAQRKARAAFGGIERIKDDTRDARGLALLDSIAQDLRYALRRLRATPGFTVAVVVTLALGIGANAAVFGMLDRLMFRPAPYLLEPRSVHRVTRTSRSGWNNAYAARLAPARAAIALTTRSASRPTPLTVSDVIP